jgi:transposase
MRKSFDGLAGLIRGEFGREPLEGGLFLFINRRGDRVKLLWWDGDGMILWYKRLEAGTFERIAPGTDASHVQIDATQLAMLLGGVSFGSIHRRKRYRRAS